MSNLVQAGFISKAIKEGAQALDGMADDAVRQTDDLLKKNDNFTPDKELSDWFQAPQGQTDIAQKFFNDFPNVMPNSSEAKFQIPLDNFWTWWAAGQTAKAVNRWQDDIEADNKSVSAATNIDEDVPITDKNGNPSFNYLINPIINELKNTNVANSDYTDNVIDLLDLLTISGRSGGLDPSSLLNPQRLEFSSAEDYVSFTSTLKAFALSRNEPEKADFFGKELDKASLQYFTTENPIESIYIPLGCLNLLTTANQIKFKFRLGSEQTFETFCSNDELLRHSKNAIASSKDAVLKVLANEELPTDDRKFAVNSFRNLHLVGQLELAITHALYGNEEEYYHQRDVLLELIKQRPDSKAISLVFSMLSVMEASFLNYGNALEFSKNVMATADGDLELMALETTFMVGLFAVQKDYARMRDLIHIQQGMAHKDSKYFVPAASKLALAASLLVVENYLYSLEES